MSQADAARIQSTQVSPSKPRLSFAPFLTSSKGSRRQGYEFRRFAARAQSGAAGNANNAAQQGQQGQQGQSNKK